jgi:hypothetical protein
LTYRFGLLVEVAISHAAEPCGRPSSAAGICPVVLDLLDEPRVLEEAGHVGGHDRGR